MKTTKKYCYPKSQDKGYLNLSALMGLAGILFLCLTPPHAFAQSDEEEAIKKDVRAATEAYFHCDPDRWQSLRVQDAQATRTAIRNGFYDASVGWKNFGPEMVNYFKECQVPDSIAFTNDNFVIRREGNLACVEYDQTLTTSNFKQLTREHRVLVKQNGQWKIASQITIAPETFGSSPEAIEANLNNTGYLLLGEKKVKEAIEVFKLNVKLFPEAWNTYDSLGEAYAMAGDTDQAIQNYKKSIALNPDNENGKEALAKLEKASGDNK